MKTGLNSLKMLKISLSTFFLRLLHKVYNRPRIWKIMDRLFYVHPTVFMPHYTFTSKFLAMNLRVGESAKVLDLGTGVGIQAIFAAENASRIIATDINPHAIKCAKINVSFNNLEHKIEVRKGNMFEPVKDEKFDVILFNPPYLSKRPKNMLERAWFCGEKNELIGEFVTDARKHLTNQGYVQILYSTLGNLAFLLRKFDEEGYKVEKIAEKNTYFEKFVIYIARLN
ncbi:MAG: HemK2/MTQ2 family protein methyltransferase [Promethearchaeota archaeon]